MYAGAIAAAAVTTSMMISAHFRTRGRRTVPNRNLSSARVSATGRQNALVEERAVGTSPLLAGHLRGVDRRDPSPAAEHEDAAARLDRQLAQVGADQDAGTAGAGVGDGLEGGLDADGV